MKWHEKLYSRMLIDNHITDCHPEYMTKFSGRNYVDMVKLAGIEGSMVYACDHNGNCYYPTKVGHIHDGVKKRDIFGETVSLLRKEGISPVAYYTVLYHNDSAIRMPSARMRDINGLERNGRYRFTCPNSPEAGAFFKAQISEILQYDVDGIFIDMTFWPMVCQCENCKKKFGKPIPQIIDWNNPRWVEFQRFREDSMAEFAIELTNFCKQEKPGVSVTHQFSPVLHGWFLGQSSGIAAAADYASGDFYGGKLQQRLGCKVFAAYSKHQPYEFMTSRCVNLQDHTSTKSPDELYIHALTTLANAGAFFFIDAINPDGTLEKKFYNKLSQVINKLEPFKKLIAKHKPVLDAQVGVYFSMSSCVDDSLNGVNLASFSDKRTNMDFRHNCILDEVLGTAEVLNKMHVPYEIITDATLDIKRFKCIIINNAKYMTEDECERIRRFVLDGGTLIATGKTSLCDRFGNSPGNFAIADILGVDYSGSDTMQINYLSANGSKILCSTPSPLVTATTAKTTGYINMPDFPVWHHEQYASIHSNPPGLADSSFTAISENNCGNGKCLYIAGSFLLLRQYTQQEFAKKIFKEYLPEFVVSSENLPGSVEITKLRSDDKSTILLGVVNYQDELPNLPLYDVTLTVDAGFTPAAVTSASTGESIPFTAARNMVTIKIPRLGDGDIFEIK
ncbi:MAG: beta-galactosidase trimerization domain-containing protein [Lentisphaeria bacterium]|nr:beta-galactosidase trimerization domain-containing protein [Lentisphaeria bacterium]